MRVPYNYLDRQFDINGQVFTDILRRVADVASRGDFTLGREVAEFEDAWCEVTGAQYAVGVSNGTDAIALSLIATNAPDTIAVPANTFVATAGAVLQAGRRLQFIDVHEETMNANYINGATIPVAWCGLVPTGVPTGVMDGAQAIGARTSDGRNLTEYFTCVTYSLHPLKNINVWGDGGVITTNNKAVADDLKLLRNHGLVDRDHIAMPGYNHRLSTMQAAVGLEVLKGFPYMWERRHQIAYQYHEAMKDTAFRPAQPYSDTSHAYHVFQIRVPQNRRDAIRQAMDAQGIETKVHYPIPLHKQTAFATNQVLPGVEQQAKEIITLPMHEYLTDEEVQHVCQTLKTLGG